MTQEVAAQLALPIRPNLVKTDNEFDFLSKF